jgi:hypothetical protein
MKLSYFKSKWEASHLSMRDFIDASLVSGFNGTETYVSVCPESPTDIKAMHADYGLELIAAISTHGTTLAEHMTSLQNLYENALKAGAVFVNCQTGKDSFSFQDNLELFRHAKKLEADYGTPLHHETHRGRALYALPVTLLYLEALPELTLTGDFSHWFCVHESNLQDQSSAMQKALDHTRHIHARVGFDQGPQVTDPQADIFAPWLGYHIALWKAVLARRKAADDKVLRITPEFGPPPYMPVDPNSGEPLRDAWSLNVWMKTYLQAHLT